MHEHDRERMAEEDEDEIGDDDCDDDDGMNDAAAHVIVVAPVSIDRVEWIEFRNAAALFVRHSHPPRHPHVVAACECASINLATR